MSPSPNDPVQDREQDVPIDAVSRVGQPEPAAAIRTAIDVVRHRGWMIVHGDGRVTLTKEGMVVLVALLNRIQDIDTGQGERPGSPELATIHLTPQQRRVVRLVSGGRTSREVAAILSVSPRTVDNHVANILAKANLRSRRQLVRVIELDPRIVALDDPGPS